MHLLSLSNMEVRKRKSQAKFSMYQPISINWPLNWKYDIKPISHLSKGSVLTNIGIYHWYFKPWHNYILRRMDFVPLQEVSHGICEGFLVPAINLGEVQLCGWQGLKIPHRLCAGFPQVKKLLTVRHEIQIVHLVLHRSTSWYQIEKRSTYPKPKFARKFLLTVNTTKQWYNLGLLQNEMDLKSRNLKNHKRILAPNWVKRGFMKQQGAKCRSAEEVKKHKWIANSIL